MNSHLPHRRFVLGSVLLLIGCTTCSVRAGWEKHEESWPVTTYTYKLGSWGPSINIIMGGPPRRTARSQTVRFDDLNLSVNLPNEHWVKLDPEQTGSRACLLLSRQNPTVFISLAVAPAGIEEGDTNSSLLAASQAKMKSLEEGVVVPGEQQLTTHGIPGVTYKASAVAADGQQVHYSIWVAAHNGYNYSLAVYGDQRYQSYIDKMMRSFLGGIRQIDPSKVAHAGAGSDIAEGGLDGVPPIRFAR